jgi:uncharacterized protein (TIGR01244 family)
MRLANDLRESPITDMKRTSKMNESSITPKITIADQPSEAEFEKLKAEGYVGVVNLRHDGEPEQPLSTTAEGEKVRACGLDYLHFGVGGAPLSEHGVNAVSQFLDHHAEGKVLVHCRKGGRAAALVLLHEAKAQGWKPDDALAKGAEMGLKVDGGLRLIVEQYLAQHPA